MAVTTRPKNLAWKPDDELTTMDAVRYLQVSKSTFLKYVRDGKAVCVNPTEPRHRYSITQLDNLRVVLATHKPQGGRESNIAKSTASKLDGQLSALVKTGSLGLLQPMLDGDDYSDDQAEGLLRKVFIRAAIDNELVEKQIALALHPRPETQQKALDTIWARILPTLKSQTVNIKADSVTQRFQETLAAKMDALRIDMQRARLFPGTTIEGEVIEDATESVDEGLLIPA